MTLNEEDVCLLVGPEQADPRLARLLKTLFPGSRLHFMEEEEGRSPLGRPMINDNFEKLRWVSLLNEAADQGIRSLASVLVKLALESQEYPSFQSLLSDKSMYDCIILMARTAYRESSLSQGIGSIAGIYENIRSFAIRPLPVARLYHCFLSGYSLLPFLRGLPHGGSAWILQHTRRQAGGHDLAGIVENMLLDLALSRADKVWVQDLDFDASFEDFQSRIRRIPSWLLQLEEAPELPSHSLLDRLAEEGERDEKTVRIGVWGETVPQNDIITVLAALGGQDSRDFTLDFFGSPSDAPHYWEECQIIAESLGLTDAIRWRTGRFGFRYQQAVDIMIVPGKFQIKGIFRAWDQGSLVLASNCPYHAEILRYDSRFIYRRKHAEELGSRLEALIRDMPSLASLRQEYRQRRTRQFSAEGLRQYFLELYSEAGRMGVENP